MIENFLKVKRDEFDHPVQKLMLTIGCMDNDQKGVEKLPTGKVYLKLLLLKILIRPFHQISQNVGS